MMLMTMMMLITMMMMTMKMVNGHLGIYAKQSRAISGWDQERGIGNQKRRFLPMTPAENDIFPNIRKCQARGLARVIAVYKELTTPSDIGYTTRERKVFLLSLQ